MGESVGALGLVWCVEAALLGRSQGASQQRTAWFGV